MRLPSINRSRHLAFAAAAVAVVWLVATVCSRLSSGVPGWQSLLPAGLAIAMALLTGRVLISLAAAVVLGGLLSFPSESPHVLGQLAREVGVEFLWNSAADLTNLLILLYVVLIMAMISVMLAAGGLRALADWLMRFARSGRSTQLITFVAGLLIFIDDYANTMVVGSTLRPACDRMHVSREKLAFLVDATAAPVAGIAVVSTWIGVEVGLLGEIGKQLAVPKDGYAMFFDALGYRFYCMTMIAFVFVSAISGRDFGPMARAERRARQSAPSGGDHARPATPTAFGTARPHPDARARVSTALLPMALLLLVFLAGLWLQGYGPRRLLHDPGALVRPSAWREVLAAIDSIPLLAVASDAGLLVAVLMAWLVARVPAGVVPTAVAKGIRTSLMPVAVLLLAWSLKGACDELGTGTYLARVLSGSLDPLVYPALVFVVAGLTAFSTGTSWGTMAILIPTAVPIALALDGGRYGPTTIISVAAVLDGAIFGDHCSPISDTTIMSSAASSCDHLAHVRTQLPYAVAVAAIALGVGYVPAAAGLPQWVGIPGAAIAAGALFLIRWRRS